MPIKYRTVKSDVVSEEILKQASSSAYRDAYAAQVEVERLKEAIKVVPEEEKEFSKTFLAQAQVDFEAKMRKFNRKNKMYTLTKTEQQSIERDHLQSWLSGVLEPTHVAHTTNIKVREASLALPANDPNAPDADERTAIAQRIDEDRKAIGIIESAHAIAVKRLDALDK